jgi:hypothetical protein
MVNAATCWLKSHKYYALPYKNLAARLTTACNLYSPVKRNECYFIPVTIRNFVIAEDYYNVYIQQDAQVTEFILSDNCCTCFGRHYHPSSEAQNKSNYSTW